jgi:MOSC domain-containing protein YiiM
LTAVTILTGRAVAFGLRGEPSAMAKLMRSEPQRLDRTGFVDDQQGDLTVHGGPEMALHHYPYDHYVWWAMQIGEHPLLDAPGAFGENIATDGLTERTACIGDRFRLGEAVVEISQGRQPCWKLNHRFGRDDILSRIVESRRSGWYYRVLETGIVAPGDMLILLDRPYPLWSVERVFALLIGGGHRSDRAAVAELTGVVALSPGWRDRAAKLAGDLAA